MSKFIDAFGKACPMPVVLAKKELDAGEKDLTVAVDNEIAVGNLKRLAGSNGIEVKVENVEGGFHVIFAGGAKTEEKSAPQTENQTKTQSAPAACSVNGCGYTVFFGKDYVGEGDYTLGHNLAKMMLYTLAESDDVPAAVIFMNSGVKMPASDKLDIVNSINTLIEKGTEVLVCGTCLNYYGITDELKAGTVSNMYEILEKMKSSAKVITV